MENECEGCNECVGLGYYDYIEEYPFAIYCMYCGRFIFYEYSKAESVLLHEEKLKNEEK